MIWKPQHKADLKTIETVNYKKINLEQVENQNNSTSGKNTTIYDCLKLFSQEEILTGTDKWVCPNCKNHVSAIK